MNAWSRTLAPRYDHRVRAFVLPSPVPSHGAALKAIGDRWFDKRVQAGLAAFDGRADLSASGQGRTFGKLEHPLIQEQYSARTGDQYRRGTTPLLDMLQRDLAALGPRLPVDVQPRLRDEREYEKIAYELHV